MSRFAPSFMLASAFSGVVLSACPAFAQDQAMLRMGLPNLAKPDSTKILGAAYSACLIGNGDVETTAALFTDAGWTRTDDDEMGVTSLSLPGAEDRIFVDLYDNGSICSVSSETLGSDLADGNLITTLGAASYSFDPLDTPDGCTAYTLNTGVVVTQTSSGQDPVCYSEDTSDTRFIFSN